MNDSASLSGDSDYRSESQSLSVASLDADHNIEMGGSWVKYSEFDPHSKFKFVCRSTSGRLFGMKSQSVSLSSVDIQQQQPEKINKYKEPSMLRHAMTIVKNKYPRERSKDDVEFLYNILSDNKSLQGVDYPTRLAMCRELGYRSLKNGDVLFMQDDDSSDGLYLIMSGSIDCWVRNTDSVPKIVSPHNGKVLSGPIPVELNNIVPISGVNSSLAEVRRGLDPVSAPINSKPTTRPVSRESTTPGVAGNNIRRKSHAHINVDNNDFPNDPLRTSPSKKISLVAGGGGDSHRTYNQEKNSSSSPTSSSSSIEENDNSSSDDVVHEQKLNTRAGRRRSRNKSLVRRDSKMSNLSKKKPSPDPFIKGEESDVDNQQQRCVATLTCGECVGEWSLVKSDKRSATCIAATDCELLTLSRDVYQRILKNIREETVSKSACLETLRAKNPSERSQTDVRIISTFLKASRNPLFLCLSSIDLECIAQWLILREVPEMDTLFIHDPPPEYIFTSINSNSDDNNNAISANKKNSFASSQMPVSTSLNDWIPRDASGAGVYVQPGSDSVFYVAQGSFGVFRRKAYVPVTNNSGLTSSLNNLNNENSPNFSASSPNNFRKRPGLNTRPRQHDLGLSFAPDGDPIFEIFEQIAELGEGSIVGEWGAVRNTSAFASVFATGKSLVLEIDRATYSRCCAPLRYLSVTLNACKDILSNRHRNTYTNSEIALILSLIQSRKLFNALESSTSGALCSAVRLRKVLRGDVVTLQGDESSAFCMLLDGKVDVFRQGHFGVEPRFKFLWRQTFQTILARMKPILEARKSRLDGKLYSLLDIDVLDDKEDEILTGKIKTKEHKSVGSASLWRSILNGGGIDLNRDRSFPQQTINTSRRASSNEVNKAYPSSSKPTSSLKPAPLQISIPSTPNEKNLNKQSYLDITTPTSKTELLLSSPISSGAVSNAQKVFKRLGNGISASELSMKPRTPLEWWDSFYRLSNDRWLTMFAAEDVLALPSSLRKLSLLLSVQTAAVVRDDRTNPIECLKSVLTEEYIPKEKPKNNLKSPVLSTTKSEISANFLDNKGVSIEQISEGSSNRCVPLIPVSLTPLQSNLQRNSLISSSQQALFSSPSFNKNNSTLNSNLGSSSSLNSQQFVQPTALSFTSLCKSRNPYITGLLNSQITHKPSRAFLRLVEESSTSFFSSAQPILGPNIKIVSRGRMKEIGIHSDFFVSPSSARRHRSGMSDLGTQREIASPSGNGGGHLLSPFLANPGGDGTRSESKNFRSSLEKDLDSLTQKKSISEKVVLSLNSQEVLVPSTPLKKPKIEDDNTSQKKHFQSSLTALGQKAYLYSLLDLAAGPRLAPHIAKSCLASEVVSDGFLLSSTPEDGPPSRRRMAGGGLSQSAHSVNNNNNSNRTIGTRSDFISSPASKWALLDAPLNSSQDAALSALEAKTGSKATPPIVVKCIPRRQLTHLKTRPASCCFPLSAAVPVNINIEFSDLLHRGLLSDEEKNKIAHIHYKRELAAQTPQLASAAFLNFFNNSQDNVTEISQQEHEQTSNGIINHANMDGNTPLISHTALQRLTSSNSAQQLSPSVQTTPKKSTFSSPQQSPDRSSRSQLVTALNQSSDSPKSLFNLYSKSNLPQNNIPESPQPQNSTRNIRKNLLDFIQVNGDPKNNSIKIKSPPPSPRLILPALPLLSLDAHKKLVSTLFSSSNSIPARDFFHLPIAISLRNSHHIHSNSHNATNVHSDLHLRSSIHRPRSCPPSFSSLKSSSNPSDDQTRAIDKNLLISRPIVPSINTCGAIAGCEFPSMENSHLWLNLNSTVNSIPARRKKSAMFINELLREKERQLIKQKRREKKAQLELEMRESKLNEKEILSSNSDESSYSDSDSDQQSTNQESNKPPPSLKIEVSDLNSSTSSKSSYTRQNRFNRPLINPDIPIRIGKAPVATQGVAEDIFKPSLTHLPSHISQKRNSEVLDLDTKDLVKESPKEITNETRRVITLELNDLNSEGSDIENGDVNHTRTIAKQIPSNYTEYNENTNNFARFIERKLAERRVRIRKKNFEDAWRLENNFYAQNIDTPQQNVINNNFRRGSRQSSMLSPRASVVSQSFGEVMNAASINLKHSLNEPTSPRPGDSNNFNLKNHSQNNPGSAFRRPSIIQQALSNILGANMLAVNAFRNAKLQSNDFSSSNPVNNTVNNSHLMQQQQQLDEAINANESAWLKSELALGGRARLLKCHEPGACWGDWSLVADASKSRQAVTLIAREECWIGVVTQKAYRDAMVNANSKNEEEAGERNQAIMILKSVPSRDRSLPDLAILDVIVKDIPMIVDQSFQLRSEVAKCLLYQSLKSGENLFIEDEDADCAFVILSGVLGMYIGAPFPACVASLTRGACIGEIALQQSFATRKSTVTAQTDVEVAILRRSDFVKIQRKHRAGSEEATIEILKHLPPGKRSNGDINAIARLISTYDLFKMNSFDSVIEAARMVTIKKLKANSILFHAGDLPDNCYCIVSGQISVHMKLKSASIASIPKSTTHKIGKKHSQKENVEQETLSDVASSKNVAGTISEIDDLSSKDGGIRNSTIAQSNFSHPTPADVPVTMNEILTTQQQISTISAQIEDLEAELKDFQFRMKSKRGFGISFTERSALCAREKEVSTMKKEMEAFKVQLDSMRARYNSNQQSFHPVNHRGNFKKLNQGRNSIISSLDTNNLLKIADESQHPITSTFLRPNGGVSFKENTINNHQLAPVDVVLSSHDLNEVLRFMTRVALLGPGAKVGERGLLQNVPRAATISATKDTDLLVVDKKTFDFVSKEALKKEQESKMRFLRKWLPGCSALHDITLDKLSYFFTHKRLLKGTRLGRDGLASDKFILVVNGTVTRYVSQPVIALTNSQADAIVTVADKLASAQPKLKNPKRVVKSIPVEVLEQIRDAAENLNSVYSPTTTNSINSTPNSPKYESLTSRNLIAEIGHNRLQSISAKVSSVLEWRRGHLSAADRIIGLHKGLEAMNLSQNIKIPRNIPGIKLSTLRIGQMIGGFSAFGLRRSEPFSHVVESLEADIFEMDISQFPQGMPQSVREAVIPVLLNVLALEEQRLARASATLLAVGGVAADSVSVILVEDESDASMGSNGKNKANATFKASYDNKNSLVPIQLTQQNVVPIEVIEAVKEYTTNNSACNQPEVVPFKAASSTKHFGKKDNHQNRDDAELSPNDKLIDKTTNLSGRGSVLALALRNVKERLYALSPFLRHKNLPLLIKSNPVLRHICSKQAPPPELENLYALKDWPNTLVGLKISAAADILSFTLPANDSHSLSLQNVSDGMSLFSHMSSLSNGTTENANHHLHPNLLSMHSDPIPKQAVTACLDKTISAIQFMNANPSVLSRATGNSFKPTSSNNVHSSTILCGHRLSKNQSLRATDTHKFLVSPFTPSIAPGSSSSSISKFISPNSPVLNMWAVEKMKGFASSLETVGAIPWFLTLKSELNDLVLSSADGTNSTGNMNFLHGKPCIDIPDAIATSKQLEDQKNLIRNQMAVQRNKNISLLSPTLSHLCSKSEQKRGFDESLGLELDNASEMVNSNHSTSTTNASPVNVKNIIQKLVISPHNSISDGNQYYHRNNHKSSSNDVANNSAAENPLNPNSTNIIDIGVATNLFFRDAIKGAVHFHDLVKETKALQPSPKYASQVARLQSITEKNIRDDSQLLSDILALTHPNKKHSLKNNESSPNLSPSPKRSLTTKKSLMGSPTPKRPHSAYPSGRHHHQSLRVRTSPTKPSFSCKLLQHSKGASKKIPFFADDSSIEQVRELHAIDSQTNDNHALLNTSNSVYASLLQAEAEQAEKYSSASALGPFKILSSKAFSGGGSILPSSREALINLMAHTLANDETWIANRAARRKAYETIQDEDFIYQRAIDKKSEAKRRRILKETQKVDSYGYLPPFTPTLHPSPPKRPSRPSSPSRALPLPPSLGGLPCLPSRPLPTSPFLYLRSPASKGTLQPLLSDDSHLLATEAFRTAYQRSFLSPSPSRQDKHPRQTLSAHFNEKQVEEQTSEFSESNASNSPRRLHASKSDKFMIGSPITVASKEFFGVASLDLPTNQPGPLIARQPLPPLSKTILLPPVNVHPAFFGNAGEMHHTSDDLIAIGVLLDPAKNELNIPNSTSRNFSQKMSSHSSRRMRGVTSSVMAACHRRSEGDLVAIRSPSPPSHNSAAAAAAPLKHLSQFQLEGAKSIQRSIGQTMQIHSPTPSLRLESELQDQYSLYNLGKKTSLKTGSSDNLAQEDSEKEIIKEEAKVFVRPPSGLKGSKAPSVFRKGRRLHY